MIALAACRGDKQGGEREPPEKTPAGKAVSNATADESPTPPPPSEPTGPRYLRPNSKGVLVDAFQFPSVPASIVEQQVAAASSRGDVVSILRRFGLGPLAGHTGHVWIGKASLVDRLGRERLLVATFRNDPSGDGLHDEASWIVFLGSTADDRVLKIGNAKITTRTADEIEVDARELHSREVDDVIATWSSCATPLQKACHFLRAWTMERGHPELIVDVTGDTKPVLSGGVYPPHEVVVDGRALKFDSEAFAYK